MTFHDFLAANYFGSNLSGFFLSFYGGRTAGNDGPAGRGGAETAVGTRRWGPGGGDPAVGTGARAGDGRAGDGRGAGRDEGGGG